MAEKLTPQQEQAVKDRGGRLLVSAAAGSGKTKVLVDRLMSYLCDPVDPANIDEFLIITFTQAAAAELRAKIGAKLSEKLAQNPEDRHLQQQFQRLYMTNISTVHAFCGNILRQFAYQLDISADFRMDSENECRQLRIETVEQVLEEAYRSIHMEPDVGAFIDTLGVGRSDYKIPDLILGVYDSSRCHLDPDGWLDGCLQAVDTENVTDAAQTRWGQSLMADLMERLDLYIRAMGQCADLAEQDEGGTKVGINLRDTVVQLQQLRNSTTWDDVVRYRSIDYGRLSVKKMEDQELAQTIVTVRDACKEGVAKATRSFADPSAQVLDNLCESADAVRGMVELVKRFAKAYSSAKERRRILDFSDLEHKMLDLLLGKRRSGVTAVAREIGARFREVMVDEYQDSNAVQDAIYSALTQQRQNCFMVGDVKQSIYQFRLADPGIFLQKYADYVPAEEAKTGEGRKVMLSRNFRSGGAILSAVNCVFETCMSPKVGGLWYGTEEALYEGVPHEPLGEPEVELYGIRSGGDTYGTETAFVAGRIRQLLDEGHLIRDKDGLRPIRPEDIVILLRSPGSVGQQYKVALENAGVRCSTGGGADLLQTREISNLRSLLQTIHNPQLDIPLVATLMSPVFGFSADELAQIRGQRRFGTIYDALRNSENEKAKAFLETLGALRHIARTESMTRLIEEIYILTRMDSLYAAMEDGELRTANLQAFFQLAAQQEGNQYDLGRFLEFLDLAEEDGLRTENSAGEGCVSIVSIHKSKGLEYPVVFLCGLSRRFNNESLNADVLTHKEMGIGISATDNDRRVRYPTVSKRAIAAQIKADSLSEELRILYVAMTRARDRLIMTYTDKLLDQELMELATWKRLGQCDLMIRDVDCLGKWVLLAALGRTEAGEFFAVAGNAGDTKVSEYPWLIRIIDGVDAVQGTMEPEESLPKTSWEALRTSLSYRYPYVAATTAPSKQTATQRKGRDKDQEIAEDAPPASPYIGGWRKPSFVDSTVQAVDYGSAVHRAMQFIRYREGMDVSEELASMVKKGLLTPEQASLIDPEQIAAFFQTEIGKRTAKVKTLWEFKFSILDDGAEFDPALDGEKILLQGVVDCALIEDDGITVLDFKTDKVKEDTLDPAVARYKPQVRAYAHALSRIYGLPVKRACLYFFRIGVFVDV